jgi:glycosyltransferase involved in cell wall biosynthesis
MKFKIVHIVEAFSTGIFSWLVDINNALNDDNFEITILHSYREETPADYDHYFSQGIKLIPIKMTSNINPIIDIKGVFQIIKYIKKAKPDVIHLHSSKAGLIGRLAYLLYHHSSIKCVYQPHGLASLRENSSSLARYLFSSAEYFLSKINTLTIACGKTEYEIMTDRMGIENAVCVPNGIDTNKFKKKSPKKSETITIATSGGIRYQKAPWLFAEIASQFISQNHIQFIWIGGGSDEEYLSSLKDSEVKITGWISTDKMIAELNDVDIFLLTSLWEGLPISLLEAQSMGIPAIVSNIVGNKDVIVDGMNGFLANEVKDYVDYINRITKSDELYKSLSTHSRGHIKKVYSQRITVQQIRMIYGMEE